MERAESITSSPNAGNCAVAMPVCLGRRWKPEVPSLGNIRPASSWATIRRRSSTASPSPTTTRKQTPAPKCSTSDATPAARLSQKASPQATVRTPIADWSKSVPRRRARETIPPATHCCWAVTAALTLSPTSTWQMTTPPWNMKPRLPRFPKTSCSIATSVASRPKTLSV